MFNWLKCRQKITFRMEDKAFIKILHGILQVLDTDTLKHIFNAPCHACPPAMHAPPPWTDRHLWKHNLSATTVTDGKNITLPQTSFAGGKYNERLHWLNQTCVSLWVFTFFNHALQSSTSLIILLQNSLVVFMTFTGLPRSDQDKTPKFSTFSCFYDTKITFIPLPPLTERSSNNPLWTPHKCTGTVMSPESKFTTKPKDCSNHLPTTLVHSTSNFGGKCLVWKYF